MSIFCINDWYLDICSVEEVGTYERKIKLNWNEMSADWWIITKKLMKTNLQDECSNGTVSHHR
jgi:hypothetical protein